MTESLILAIREGNIEVTKILMSIHHDINVYNQDRETPIMLAAAERQVDILKVLIVARAKANIKDKTKPS